MAWTVGDKKTETRKSTNTRIVELGGAGQEGGAGHNVEKKMKGTRNLAGGMEMLELEFLLGVIERTDGANKTDVEMRKLSFNEVLRRKEQTEVDSGVLSLYAVDGSGLYGKGIQCAAMQELTRRTTSKG